MADRRRTVANRKEKRGQGGSRGPRPGADGAQRKQEQHGTGAAVGAAGAAPAAPAPGTASPPAPSPPASRRLRVYAFDPTLGMRLETAVLNEAVLKVKWESDLQAGPVGEYLEIIDHDPATGCFYTPVNLNEAHLLAQDGLPPSEGNPRFHQQMVYAVAMTTIAHFERALGRRALWAERRYDEQGKRLQGMDPRRFVERLRIYPHALREANAYYSPDKKALLFGYFPAARSEVAGNLPGGMVFTCLSHDIIAHETTHALLDGLHRRFNEPSNPDVLAFHEAFADIVALFQHFTFPEAIRHQIAQTRGDLRRQNILGALALQFGQALGSHGALRDAIGRFEGEEWKPYDPKPEEYEATTEPHGRGAILVAAVFDAFLAIYRHRIADLLRIATGGSGVLPAGELHPDLVQRLAGEAVKSAQHVLLMCIRALDYCPPVDITFGEYLRALVTADFDLVPADDRHYRIAFIEAFRRRGIYPRDVRTLSVDSLKWNSPVDEEHQALQRILPNPGELGELSRDWNLTRSRRRIHELNLMNAARVHDYMMALKGEAIAEGLSIKEPGAILGLKLGDHRVPFEVHSVRPARRVGPDAQQRTDWVIEITQRRPAWIDPDEQAPNERRFHETAEGDRRRPQPDFFFRGGSTLIFDADTGRVRYVIRKNILSDRRLEREREHRGGSQSLFETYFAEPDGRRVVEPFALLHRAF